MMYSANSGGISTFIEQNNKGLKYTKEINQLHFLWSSKKLNHFNEFGETLIAEVRTSKKEPKILWTVAKG